MVVQRTVAIVAAVVFAVVVFVFPRSVAASAHNELFGWAWNEHAGWISMNFQNCVDFNAGTEPDPCALGGVDYHVEADDRGFLTGYAWSSAVGWICFGTTCAGSGGNTPTGAWIARIDAVSQQVSGWAKVLTLGESGWIALSCENTASAGCASYRTTWTPPPFTGGLGTLNGHAWNGTTTGSALGWILWQPGFEADGGGVRTSWNPTPRCTESGDPCTSHFDCNVLGELCCLGGADCGQCEGANRCGFAGDCTAGTICCPADEPQCGRCTQNYAQCGRDGDCPDLAVDSCCPPGAVCTRTDPSVATTDSVDPSNPQVVPGTLGGAVGFCASSLGSGEPIACIDEAHCGGGICSTDPPHGLCASSELQDCTRNADCASATCSVEVGLCTVNSGTHPIACLTDQFCATHSGINDATAVCRKIVGECSPDTETNPKLCVVDGNCVDAGSRCEQLYLPWLETQYGPIYSGGAVGSPQTAPPPPGRHNATYCILAGGPIINFLSEPGACDAGPESLTQTPYVASAARLDVPGITLGRYGEVTGPPPSTSVTPTTVFTTDANGITLGDRVYLVDGNFTVGTDGVVFRNGVGAGASGAGLIMVRGGDLTIMGNVRYRTPDDPVFNVAQLASPGWLVLAGEDAAGNRVGGNVTIDPGVTELVGAIYAEGTIRTGTTGSRAEQPLLVRGVMLAQTFLLERTHGSSVGAEQVIADGRVLVSTPPGFGDLVRSLPRIQQTVPGS